ncbi:MAG TPA: HAMP domain-containing histidine kinase [Aquificaceae bacterium]|nr:HAMP domain-containing histidine kinase [Aquificaceae bacterium]
MKELLENLEDGIALLNHEGRVVYMNKFLRERLGKTSNNGYYYETFRSIDLIGLIQETLTRKEPLEKTFTYKEGTYEAKTFFSEEGVGLLVKEVSKKAIMDTLKKEFLANLSHELKTPLSVISLALETLLYEETEESKKNLINRALNRIKELQNLIETVYLLTFWEKGKETLSERVELKNLIEEIINDYKEELESKNLRIFLQLKEKVINGDREKIRLMLRNLIDNAIRYNKKGGEIRILTDKEENSIILVISDTGIGIDKRRIPLIFEPFIKGEESKGLGLGLSLVKKIAQMHNAQVHIQSQPDKGTIVKVKFPVS